MDPRIRIQIRIHEKMKWIRNTVYYPLVEVGLVAVVVVHVHVLEAVDNLETYFNDFIFKKHA